MSTATEDWTDYYNAHNDTPPDSFTSASSYGSALDGLLKSALVSSTFWDAVLANLGDVGMPSGADPQEFEVDITDYLNGVADPSCDGNDGYRLFSNNFTSGLEQLGPDGTWATIDFGSNMPPTDASYTPVPGVPRTYLVTVPSGIQLFGPALARIVGEITINESATTDTCVSGSVDAQVAAMLWNEAETVLQFVPELPPLPTIPMTCATVQGVFTPQTNGPLLDITSAGISDLAEYVVGYTATQSGATIDRWQRIGTSWSSGVPFAYADYNPGGDPVQPRLAISGDGETVAGCWMGGPYSSANPQFPVPPGQDVGFSARWPQIIDFATGVMDYPSNGSTSADGCGDVTLDQSGSTVWYQVYSSGWFSSPTAPGAPIVPVTVVAPSPTVTYGLAIPQLLPTYTGMPNGATPTTPATCQAVNSAGDPLAHLPPAGTYEVICTGAADPSYSYSYASGTLTVEPAALTVTASSPTMTFASSLPAVTASFFGFVNGDGPASLTAQPTCLTTATSSSQPGTYETTCSGAADPNYAITYVPGTLTLLLVAGAPNSSYYGTGPSLSGENLKGKNLSGQNLLGANLSDAKLQGANLSGADLQGVNFEGADLHGVNLQGADLAGSNLYGATLEGTNLQDATLRADDLQGADLKGVNLQGADLSYDNLIDANLPGVNLQRTNLTDADLQGASLTGANIASATWSNTICPDGTNSDLDGGTCSGHL